MPKVEIDSFRIASPTCKNCFKIISMPELIMISKWIPLDFHNLKCDTCQFSEVIK